VKRAPALNVIKTNKNKGLHTLTFSGFEKARVYSHLKVPVMRLLLFLQTLEQQHKIFAVLLFLALGGVVMASLGFQYIGGQIPCKLCLQERIPYYISAPIMLVTICLVGRLPSLAVRLLFAVVFVVMLYGFGLAVYHAGAEWKFWEGPTDCAPAAAIVIEDASSLLDSLNIAVPVSCSEASFYFLGLSLAGWNGVSSLFGCFVAAIAAFMRRPKLA